MLVTHLESCVHFWALCTGEAWKYWTESSEMAQRGWGISAMRKDGQLGLFGLGMRRLGGKLSNVYKFLKEGVQRELSQANFCGINPYVTNLCIFILIPLLFWLALK